MANKERTPVTYYILSRVELEQLKKEIYQLQKRDKRLINLPDMTKVTLQDLNKVFSFCHETTSRVSNVIELRHFARYFLCCHTSMSLKRIAIMTNCADHSTVIHSRDKIEGDIKRYEIIESKYTGFEKRIISDLENLINDKESKSVNEVQEVLTECV